MKAITLWQPWAQLIADGRKKVETRPRPWNYNGLVFIHAGQHVDREACIRFGYDPDTIPRGAIVAVAYKCGCVQFPSPLAVPDDYGDFTAGRYGYPFITARKTVPFPIKGHQGFWSMGNFPIEYDGPLFFVADKETAARLRSSYLPQANAEELFK